VLWRVSGSDHKPLRPVGCGNRVTRPRRTHERHRRDDPGAKCERRRTPTPMHPGAFPQVARETALDAPVPVVQLDNATLTVPSFRHVRYPWHPWFGRSVTVYEALTKGGHAICRCGFDDRRTDRSLEVPAWMFEPAACDHLRLHRHGIRSLPGLDRVEGRVRCVYSIGSRRALVLVQESAETVATFHFYRLRRRPRRH
jgi:hypothetical protein